MKNLKIFLQQNERNDATSFYIDLIVKGLSSKYDRIEYVSEITQIQRDDVVLVITLRSYFKLLKNRIGRHFIFWFQGVEPEELMLSKKTIRDKLRIFWFEALEKMVLNRAQFIFFVSNIMVAHYENKYGYKKKNYCVIPCFNATIDKEAFYTPGKYEKPTFIYAGGMMKWQCIPETISFFSKIKKEIPDATLTFLTKEIEEAKRLCIEGGLELEGILIKYVPLENLSAELKKYKYGFLLRHDLVMNNVATPNKINSYMSVGIIPVMSEVIKDFSDKMSEITHKVVVPSNMDFSIAVDRICKLESSKISPQAIYDEYNKFFNYYYNTAKYVGDIQKVKL